METTRLSTKGQIILPKQIRDARSLEPGVEFTVEDTEDGILLRPVTRSPRVSIEALRGSLGPPKSRKPLTEANIRQAIGTAVKRRHALGRY